MLGINAKSKVQPAAWKFIDHYVNFDSQVIMAEVAGDFPTRKSVFKQPFMSQPANVYLKDFATILDTASRGPIRRPRLLSPGGPGIPVRRYRRAPPARC